MACLPRTGPSGATAAPFKFQRNEVDAVTFSALEWLVVAVAARDSLDSLREPGRIALAFGSLLGSTTRPSLADSHLEELRRATVLARLHGQLKANERLRFYGAGYKPAHYHLLCESIAVALETSVSCRDGNGKVALALRPYGSGLH